MRVSVQCQHWPVRLKCALKSRTAQKREDGLRLADDGFLDRSVVGDGNLLPRQCLRQTVVEFHGFALGNFDKGLASLLAERHQFIRSEAAAEPLSAGET